MQAHLSVYWDKTDTGEYACFLGFEALDKSEIGAVDVEEVLPAECRGQARAPKEAIDFFRLLQPWLASPHFWREAQAKAEQAGAKVSVDYPPVDLKHYRLIDADGELIPKHVRALVGLIAPYWRGKPEPGLLYRLFEASADIAVIETRLLAFSRYRDLPCDDDRMRLGKLLLPPECRDGSVLLADGQFDVALRWLKRDTSKELRQDALLWNLNLRELGLVGNDGRLNEAATQAASDYIWARRDETPDFQALKAHLAPFRADVAPSRNTEHKQAEQNAVARKLAKARKQAKLSRKRRRRRR